MLQIESIYMTLNECCSFELSVSHNKVSTKILNCFQHW